MEIIFVLFFWKKEVENTKLFENSNDKRTLTAEMYLFVTLTSKCCVFFVTYVSFLRFPRENIFSGLQRKETYKNKESFMSCDSLQKMCSTSDLKSNSNKPKAIRVQPCSVYRHTFATIVTPKVFLSPLLSKCKEKWS